MYISEINEVEQLPSFPLSIVRISDSENTSTQFVLETWYFIDFAALVCNGKSASLKLFLESSVSDKSVKSFSL